MEKSVLAKVSRRIIPFIFILYLAAFLDRVNIGYAALDMNRELGLSPEQFGLLSGIFFWGYFLFEVPSNILLHRVGARRWVARILVSWGFVVMLTAFALDYKHLLWLRFFLGVAEAGFFPGIILYLTYWFPAGARARAVAWFMTALTVSNIIGAPLSTAIMEHTGWWGYSGWRWLFILEGAPSVLLGVITWFYLTDRPAQAAWLNENSRRWLETELEKERAANPGAGQSHYKAAFTNARVWRLSAIYFGHMVALYGSVFWLPQLVRQLDNNLSIGQIGWVTMLPYITSAAAMILWSRHSDKTGERRWHSIIPALAGAAGFAGCQGHCGPVVEMLFLTFAMAGVYSFFGPFWTMPASFLTGEAAAAGIAIVNSVGNLGGFFGPFVIGWIAERTGDIRMGLLFPAALMLVNALLLFSVRAPKPAAACSAALK